MNTAPEPRPRHAHCRFCGHPRTAVVEHTPSLITYAPHNVPDQGVKCIRSLGRSVDRLDLRP